MYIRRLIYAFIATLALPASNAVAQQPPVEDTWEFGIALIYMTGREIGFNGGSTLDVDDDMGVALSWGYRFTPKLELHFVLDWNEVSYDGRLQSAQFPGVSADISGDMEWFTPRVAGLYNFTSKAFTPYVTAGVGWSFIDTNIPTGQVSVGCWWDPWWGQICTPYQPTFSTDEFTYQLGAGLRWDVADSYTLRLSWERVWLDLSEATSTPDLDHFKFGFLYHY
jgi:opacity protein-like surface antigen